MLPFNRLEPLVVATAKTSTQGIQHPWAGTRNPLWYRTDCPRHRLGEAFHKLTERRPKSCAFRPAGNASTTVFKHSSTDESTAKAKRKIQEEANKTEN